MRTTGTRAGVIPPARPFRLAIVWAWAGLLLVPAWLAAAKVESWRHENASEFRKGKRERVVVSDSGRVRLARKLGALEGKGLDAARVWDLARTGQGTVFAATGDEGKVFRREGSRGDWTVAYDADDTQALCLAVTGDGKVFAGTGPNGKVVEVSAADHPASRPDPKVQYIWDLAVDPAGNLYAATGPTGQLWKRSPAGAWSLLLDSKHPHLLCVAVAPDGSVYAGSDGEGLIYRVAPDGKTSVVYDAPQNEVRTLLVAPDGTLYAGTAEEAGGGSSSRPGRGLVTLDGPAPSPTRGALVGDEDDPAPSRDNDAEEVAQPVPPPSRPTPPSPASGGARSAEPPGGTASPRPARPGDNAVYRVARDGVPREVFRARVMIYALAWQDDRLFIGTGPSGELYEVRDLGRESAPIARLDTGQVLALLADSDGDLLLGAGDPGTVLRLTADFAPEGSLTSDVLDTKLISRFGTLTWRAEIPSGTSVEVRVRTGNVGEPDATWSDWSAPRTDPDAGAVAVSAARFVQYRLRLKTGEARRTPEVRSLALYYQTINLPPELSKITVPDVEEGEGSSRSSKVSLKWNASDPNNDDLTYTVAVRKEGWPDWVRIGEEPLTDANLSWDANSVPTGIYRVRVTASDRPSNSPDDTLTATLVSDPFLIDHEAPSVAIEPRTDGARVEVKDALTRLVKASYALDGGDWTPVFPTDGLFDSPRETIAITLPDLKPGTHVLMVRVTDAAGNMGTGDAVLKGR